LVFNSYPQETAFDH